MNSEKEKLIDTNINEFNSGCDCSKIACYNDDRWNDAVYGAMFQMKVYHCWFGIFHLANFVVLTSIAATQNTFNSYTTIVDTSNNQIGSIQLSILTVVAVLTTALFHLTFEIIAVCTKNGIQGSAAYHDLQEKKNPWRYITYALANSLQLFCVCVISGVRDINFLLVIIMINVLTNFCFLTSEFRTKKTKRDLFHIGAVTGIMLWPFIIRRAVLTNSEPSTAGAISIAMLNHFFNILVMATENRLTNVEYDTYLSVIDFVCKTIISWLVFNFYF